MNLLKSSLVDLKNGLPPRAFADQLHPRGIVFVHVPKCAGTSFEEALRRHYRISRTIIDPDRSFQAAAAELGLTATDETRHLILNRASEIRRTLLDYALSMGYKCITGHAPLGPNTLKSRSGTHDFVTILRDPVKRYLSHLAHNASEAGGHGGSTLPVSDFLETDRARMMGALFLKYFSGLPMGQVLSNPAAAELTKETLEKMDAVGFQDRLEDFAGDVTCLTGNRIRIGHENRARSEVNLSLSDENLEKIRHLCAPDQAVYDWARAQFSGIDDQTVA